MEHLPDGTFLRLSEATVARRRRVVLRGVNVDLRAREVVHLAGANGSGKTSLLRVFAGVAGVRAGRVERRTQRCALVPERLALPADVVAGDWLRALRRLRGGPDVCPDDLRSAGVGDGVLRSRAGQLSKGQLQRVALVEALTAQVDLVALDEPWAGLDPPGRAWLADRVAGAGAAVVFTDHSGAHGDGVPVDRRLRTQDGRLEEEDHRAGLAPGTVTIRHRGPDGISTTEHVADGASDARLRALLADGRSIDEVRRT